MSNRQSSWTDKRVQSEKSQFITPQSIIKQKITMPQILIEKPGITMRNKHENSQIGEKKNKKKRLRSSDWSNNCLERKQVPVGKAVS